MAANTIVLIVVAATAMLVLAGMTAGVAYKTRTIKRHVNGETLRDQAVEGAQRLRRRQALADECAATAHAAEVEIQTKTIRARGLQQQASALRSEAASFREQLNEQTDSADTFGAAARTREMPEPGGYSTLRN